MKLNTLPKANITPAKWWLGDDPFLLGLRLFSGPFAVSFRKGFPGLLHVQVAAELMRGRSFGEVQPAISAKEEVQVT